MYKFTWLAMLLVACGDKEEDAPPDLVNTENGGDSCGGASPGIQSVPCENSGVQNHQDYGNVPTFTIWVNATDEDADLTNYQLYVDIDAELDGTESEDDIELTPVSGNLSNNNCSIDEANVGLTIFMQGGPPNFDTTYEWYVRVSDTLGAISSPEMVVCRTPDSDGAGDPYELGESNE